MCRQIITVMLIALVLPMATLKFTNGWAGFFQTFRIRRVSLSKTPVAALLPLTAESFTPPF